MTKQGFDLHGGGDDGFPLKGRILFGLLAIGFLVGGVGHWATATTISGAVIASPPVSAQTYTRIAAFAAQPVELTARRARPPAEYDGLETIDFPTSETGRTPTMLGETMPWPGNPLTRNRHKEQLTMQEHQIGEEV